MAVAANQPLKKNKAIALMSGGLDSTLAAKLMLDQGIEVIGLHLYSAFGCLTEVQESAKELGIELLIKEKGAAYLDLIKDPAYGYGKAMNPCIDCRIYMFDIAEHIRTQQGADFIITGEVLGQRPMSQQRNSMNLIDNNSPAAERVLRPLSAKLFKPTLVEEQGLVDRERLLDISGRSRKRQLQLAKDWGLKAFAPPGGGCLLTEVSFTSRLKDFFSHDENTPDDQRLAQTELLRVGRHFRINENTKAVIGRNQKDNSLIESLSSKTGGTYFKCVGFAGPDALVIGPVDADCAKTVGALISRYGKPAQRPDEKITWNSEEMVPPAAINEAQLEQMRI